MKKILLCVCGGIAAYKAIDLASLLRKKGFEVKCVLTSNAQRFVSALSFAAITQNTVHTSMFEDTDPIPHIRLADWADLVVIAPATANIMAKAAYGLADDLLSTVLVAHRKPALFVPAMNVFMYQSQATKDNMSILKGRGHHILDPSTGLLACGYEGKGKYPPNEEVIAAIETYITHEEDLKGKKVVVTVGATVEAIDPMRYISNRSSGKMGLAVARALSLRGAEVCLIHGQVVLEIPYYLHEVVHANTADEMHRAVMQRYQDYDWIIKCAAVADYQTVSEANAKLPKEPELILSLKSTIDILAELGEKKLANQKLIGFAAQTENLVGNAIAKLKRKNLDLVCANSISTVGQDSNTVTVIGKLAGYPSLPEDPMYQYYELTGDKLTVAHGIIDIIKTL